MNMAYDPLAQFRKSAPAPRHDDTPRMPSEDYAAFGAKDKVQRLRIRSRLVPTNAPGYNILLNVISDTQGTHFILVFTILMVLVRGRNLQRVVFAIENDLADFIQEFDPAKWPKPKDNGEPIIESIELKATEGDSANRGDETLMLSKYARRVYAV
jgi:hypothetical protein